VFKGVEWNDWRLLQLSDLGNKCDNAKMSMGGACSPILEMRIALDSREGEGSMSSNRQGVTLQL